MAPRMRPWGLVYITYRPVYITDIDTHHRLHVVFQVFGPYNTTEEHAMKTYDPRDTLETKYSVPAGRLTRFTEAESQSILDLAARTAASEAQPTPERLAEIALECITNLELAIQATSSEIIHRS